MAKFKTGIETDRPKDEMRNIDVEIDFTPNALESILYPQATPKIVFIEIIKKSEDSPKKRYK